MIQRWAIAPAAPARKPLSRPLRLPAAIRNLLKVIVVSFDRRALKDYFKRRTKWLEMRQDMGTNGVHVVESLE
jgi:hypothetical protein